MSRDTCPYLFSRKWTARKQRKQSQHSEVAATAVLLAPFSYENGGRGPTGRIMCTTDLVRRRGLLPVETLPSFLDFALSRFQPTWVAPMHSATVGAAQHSGLVCVTQRRLKQLAADVANSLDVFDCPDSM